MNALCRLKTVVIRETAIPEGKLPRSNYLIDAAMVHVARVSNPYVSRNVVSYSGKQPCPLPRNLSPEDAAGFTTILTDHIVSSYVIHNCKLEGKQ